MTFNINAQAGWNIAAVTVDGRTWSTQIWRATFGEALRVLREHVQREDAAGSPVVTAVVACHDGGHTWQFTVYGDQLGEALARR